MPVVRWVVVGSEGRRYVTMVAFRPVSLSLDVRVLSQFFFGPDVRSYMLPAAERAALEAAAAENAKTDQFQVSAATCLGSQPISLCDPDHMRPWLNRDHPQDVEVEVLGDGCFIVSWTEGEERVSQKYSSNASAEGPQIRKPLPPPPPAVEEVTKVPEVAPVPQDSDFKLEATESGGLLISWAVG